MTRAPDVVGATPILGIAQVAAFKLQDSCQSPASKGKRHLKRIAWRFPTIQSFKTNFTPTELLELRRVVTNLAESCWLVVALAMLKPGNT